MGGDEGSRRSSSLNVPFQSTPPHGGRRGDKMTETEIYGFQSTPPHGGRPVLIAVAILHKAVSIHAPAWGATAGGPRNGQGGGVSIHAPAWGATAVRG